VFATYTRINGAANEPRILLPKFCMTPMLSPRRWSLDSAASSDCEIGRIPPSDRPITSREVISIANDVASPEPSEQNEKITMQTMSTLLRRPVASE
jgi:hypothetical protein